ncbi:MAG: MinD/ParA family protein [Gammaproteobacteria bacterium]|nr:MinD/ParA family protein [Gammaproteobacteria bacterium]
MLVSEPFNQTHGLRRNKNKPVRVIAVTSGKGGVGKTSVAVNLGVSLASMGKDVLLMDADLGLANVDVMLGLRPRFNLSHVVSGERALDEVVVDGPEGLKIVPASSGIHSMAVLGSAEHAGVIRAFSELNFPLDVLLIDTAAGISGSVIAYTKAAQEVIVVLCDEPASITDAYALIKILSREYGLHRFHVITNMVSSIQNGKDLYRKILQVTDRYLDVALDFMGVIPNDEYLRKAIQRQKSVIDAFPRCKSSLAFKKLAQKADSWPMPASAGGRLEFFVERLIMASQHGTGVSL